LGVITDPAFIFRTIISQMANPKPIP